MEYRFAHGSGSLHYDLSKGNEFAIFNGRNYSGFSNLIYLLFSVKLRWEFLGKERYTMEGTINEAAFKRRKVILEEQEQDMKGLKEIYEKAFSSEEYTPRCLETITENELIEAHIEGDRRLVGKALLYLYERYTGVRQLSLQIPSKTLSTLELSQTP
ncbi:MAG: hypothetical protein U9O94_10625 [Nanoarchaeota archaeon]|nr:hypothetical protein [Nanoarchaeota archaeon]